MVMFLIPPERLNHLLGRFRKVLSKPQFENFRSVMFGLIMSGCKEHDVKSMRDTVGETKCQSSINRFFTSPSWNLDDVMKCAQEIIFSKEDVLVFPTHMEGNVREEEFVTDSLANIEERSKYHKLTRDDFVKKMVSVTMPTPPQYKHIISMNRGDKAL